MPTDTMNVTPAWEGSRKIEPEGGLTEADLSSTDAFDPWGDDSNGAEAEEKTGGAPEQSPTTETEEEAVISTEATEEAPTTEQKTEAPKKLKFQAKVDHKVSDVELDFDELPSIYQTAQNYSRMEKKYNDQRQQLQQLEALSAQLGYESIQDMIEQSQASDREARIKALVEEGTSQKIAEDFVDRDIEKVRQSRKIKAEDPAERKAEAEEKEKPSSESDPDFKSQVAELFKLRPELKSTLKTLPQEVVTDVIENNTPLRVAYAEYEAKQLKAENERIRREKELLAQQADSASRAPVRGATDRKDDKGDPEDPFLNGFNRRRW